MTDRVSVRLPGWLLRELDKLAEDTGLTRSDIVRLAVRWRCGHERGQAPLCH